jgi:hypothetical protein
MRSLLPCIALVGCLLISCSTQPQAPKFKNGDKVMVGPGKLAFPTSLERAAFSDKGLLFTDASTARAYGRGMETGNMTMTVQAYGQTMLPIDSPLHATVLEYQSGDRGEGPSKIQLDLAKLPSDWKVDAWKRWEVVWAFNSHLSPTAPYQLTP